MIEKLKTLLQFKKENDKSPKTIDEKIFDMYSSLEVDTLTIAFGDDILPFAINIVNALSKFRFNLKDKSGFILPPVRIIHDKNLQENELQIHVRGNIVFSDFAIPTKDYILKTTMTNLSSIVTKNISSVFSNEITEKYIDLVQKNNSWLIWNVLRLVPVTGIRSILVDILNEGKSIKDIVYVFERICEHATDNKDFFLSKDPHKIAEKVIKDLV